MKQQMALLIAGVSFAAALSVRSTISDDHGIAPAGRQHVQGSSPLLKEELPGYETCLGGIWYEKTVGTEPYCARYYKQVQYGSKQDCMSRRRWLDERGPGLDTDLPYYDGEVNCSEPNAEFQWGTALFCYKCHGQEGFAEPQECVDSRLPSRHPLPGISKTWDDPDFPARFNQPHDDECGPEYAFCDPAAALKTLGYDNYFACEAERKDKPIKQRLSDRDGFNSLYNTFCSKPWDDKTQCRKNWELCVAHNFTADACTEKFSDPSLEWYSPDFSQNAVEKLQCQGATSESACAKRRGECIKGMVESHVLDHQNSPQIFSAEARVIYRQCVETRAA